MSLKLHVDFDPYFETLGLLIFSNNFESSKTNMIEELNKLGISGNSLYTSQFTIWESTIRAFIDKKKTNAYYDFFFSIDYDGCCYLHLLLIALIADHLELIKSQDTTINELKELMIYIIAELAGQAKPQPSVLRNDLYSFLETLETSETEKWKLFTLFQRPDEYLKNLINLIDINIPLFRKIYKQKEVLEFIRKQCTVIESSDEPTILSDVMKEQIVYPTLVHPIVQIVSETKAYYGLLNTNMFHSDDFTEKVDDNILIKLKALSDKSKLQILVSLKRKAMYSLELAEELQLSPGTISHHMNVLLATNLVRVEKSSGKIYYYLDENGIESFLNKLKTILF